MLDFASQPYFHHIRQSQCTTSRILNYTTDTDRPTRSNPGTRRAFFPRICHLRHMYRASTFGAQIPRLSTSRTKHSAGDDHTCEAIVIGRVHCARDSTRAREPLLKGRPRRKLRDLAGRRIDRALLARRRDRQLLAGACPEEGEAGEHLEATHGAYLRMDDRQGRRRVLVGESARRARAPATRRTRPGPAPVAGAGSCCVGAATSRRSEDVTSPGNTLDKVSCSQDARQPELARP